MELIKIKEFDDTVEAYKKLPLSEKKKIVDEEFKKLSAVLYKLIDSEEILYNKEILETASEEDFVEYTYVYIKSIEELLAEYVSNK